MRVGQLPFVITILAACSTPAETPGLTPTLEVEQPLPATATVTPEPLAARVNGEAITLAQFERELGRYEGSLTLAGIDLATQGDYRSEVLQTLIERKLLVQAALAIGPDLSEAELDALIADLQLGEQELHSWLSNAGYTDQEFRTELREEKLAARMIDSITAALPAEVEQVHARHILVSTEAEAEILLQDLASGLEFSLLARQNSLDPSTQPAGGDLGWFPRGVLLVPELDELAFSLQPGEISGVIQTELGFHILEVLERERRPLTGTALIEYRTAAVNGWLADQRERAEIEVLVDV
jgi:peptidyl-prolyl cis-trans isomerase C